MAKGEKAPHEEGKAREMVQVEVLNWINGPEGKKKKLQVLQQPEDF